MPYRRLFYVHGRLGVIDWLVVFATLTVIVSIVVAIAVVAVSVFLVLLPVVAITVALSYLWWRLRHPRYQGLTVIDGEFRALDPEQEQREERAPH